MDIVGIADSIAPSVAPAEIPAPENPPLYLFSLDVLCEGGTETGAECERDEESNGAVAATLMALVFAGAEVWVIGDRPVSDSARTSDWLTRNGIHPTTVYLGYRWGSETGMDAEDYGRLLGVFERRGNEDRWPGLPVFSCGEGRRIVLAA